MTHTFLISDESVNSYGMRILTEGIRTVDFEKNPIVLWNHTRPYSDREDQVLPIGKCIKLWKDQSKLYAEVEFDDGDAFAMKIAKKVEKGIISACSVSLDIITTSEDSSVIIQGQCRPTIIESSLRELSVVDIPSNKNCVRLFDQNKEINFSDTNIENHLLPIINFKNMEFKKDVQAALSLKDANEETLLAKIKEFSGQASSLAKVQADLTNALEKLKKYEFSEKEAHAAKIQSLVDDAIASKKILASQKELYLSLAGKDFDGIEKVLSSMQEIAPLDNSDKDTAKSPWDDFHQKQNSRK